jgi:hypothetical protein
MNTRRIPVIDAFAVNPRAKYDDSRTKPDTKYQRPNRDVSQCADLTHGQKTIISRPGAGIGHACREANR